MALIVVKENQTVRGVKMSEQLTNIIKILLVTFILLFAWNEAFGKTTTVEILVNGEPSIFPIVSITEEPHAVKVKITDNETGKIIEGEVTTEETEEEPDCE